MFVGFCMVLGLVVYFLLFVVEIQVGVGNML